MVQTMFFINLIFLLKINFLCVLNYFNVLILKIIFKKYYFDVFQHEKHFNKQPHPKQIRQ
jgi:hypothetical protein